MLNNTHNAFFIMIKNLVVTFIAISITIAFDSAIAENVQFFPPSNCVKGALNVITWDGQDGTKCMLASDFFKQLLKNSGCTPGQKITMSNGVLKCQ